jgi:hypothetical protein
MSSMPKFWILGRRVSTIISLRTNLRSALAMRPELLVAHSKLDVGVHASIDLDILLRRSRFRGSIRQAWIAWSLKEEGKRMVKSRHGETITRAYKWNNI